MDRTVPPAAAKLLDFIGSVEAPRGYDTVYANQQLKGGMPKRLTAMTVDEVIADGPRRTHQFGSSAAGRYQIMARTLTDLRRELGLRGTQVFDANLQDRLAYHLLRRRGYDRWVGGNLPSNHFARNLAQEWAALPVVGPTQGAHRYLSRGQSYYAGDGKNKALVHPSRVEAVLKSAFEAGNVVVPLPPDVEHPDTEPIWEPAPAPGWAAFWKKLADAMRGIRT